MSALLAPKITHLPPSVKDQSGKRKQGPLKLSKRPSKSTPAKCSKTEQPHGELWAAWIKSGRRNKKIEAKLVDAYYQMVYDIVSVIVRDYKSRWLTLDDTFQAMMVWFVSKFLQTYDPSKGSSVTSFLHGRLRWRTIDYIRDQSFSSRTEVARRKKEGKQASAVFRVADCYNFVDRDSEDVVNSAELQFETNRMPSVHYIPVSNDVEAFEDLDFFNKLVSIAGSKKAAEALTLYYAKGETMRRVGEIMDLSESRVSQIISDALVKLKESRRVKELVEDAK